MSRRADVVRDSSLQKERACHSARTSWPAAAGPGVPLARSGGCEKKPEIGVNWSLRIVAMQPQACAPYLYQRARAPRELELADIPWLRGLEPHERDRALADLKVVQVNVGELLCRVGRPVTYWFGVIEGPAEDEQRQRAGSRSRSPACRPAAGSAKAP
jgi:hypothetical protein